MKRTLNFKNAFEELPKKIRRIPLLHRWRMDRS